jgi:hypothetical protein
MNRRSAHSRRAALWAGFTCSCLGIAKNILSDRLRTLNAAASKIFVCQILLILEDNSC